MEKSKEKKMNKLIERIEIIGRIIVADPVHTVGEKMHEHDRLNKEEGRVPHYLALNLRNLLTAVFLGYKGRYRIMPDLQINTFDGEPVWTWAEWHKAQQEEKIHFSYWHQRIERVSRPGIEIILPGNH